MNVGQVAADAERALLGAMLLSSTAVWTGLGIVSADDYHEPRHQVLHEVIEGLASRGEVVDTITVVDEALRLGLGGTLPADFVVGLTSEVVSAGSAGYHAEIVLRHSGLRRAAAAAQTLAHGVAEGRDVRQVIDEARAILDKVTDERGTLEPVGEAMSALVESLDRPPTLYPTPWPDLNGYIHGLMPGGVYVIAARPGAGKTIAGMQIAAELTKHGNVVVHSLEMPKNQLLHRLIAAHGSVSLTALSKHSLTPDDWEKFNTGRLKVLEMPMFIDDRSGVSITQIEAYARQVARRGKLSGIIVDYLQLIPSRDPRKSRWEHVGELTRAFKTLAKDLDVPVVLLSQINRESEKNRRLPGLHDLRESGSIEQDADVVLMQQRRVDSNGEFINELDMVIAKNRHGSTGRIEFAFEGKYARLSKIDFSTPTIDYRAMQAGTD